MKEVLPCTSLGCSYFWFSLLRCLCSLGRSRSISFSSFSTSLAGLLSSDRVSRAHWISISYVSTREPETWMCSLFWRLYSLRYNLISLRTGSAISLVCPAICLFVRRALILNGKGITLRASFGWRLIGHSLSEYKCSDLIDYLKWHTR